jgi:hypothetical protein
MAGVARPVEGARRSKLKRKSFKIEMFGKALTAWGRRGRKTALNPETMARLSVGFERKRFEAERLRPFCNRGRVRA